MANIAVCMCTYKRPRLLSLLIQDLLEQTLQPDHLIIVDGNPSSGDVPLLLKVMQIDISTTYIPSNYGNLAYQRYLGWCAARQLGVEVIIYFDDDLRIGQADVVSRLVFPLGKDGVVGVGCTVSYPQHSDGSDASEARRSARQLSLLVKLFGSGRNTAPGDVTPTGHRVRPQDNQSEYIKINWLNGGAMAYWMSAIDQDTFSDDMFALDHLRCGLGEDTFLSRRVGSRGTLLYTFHVFVEHPNADTPKSYPHDAYKYAYAAAYSRRFLNDYYRIYQPPTLADRWVLVKSYAGNVLLAWVRALSKPTKLNVALARGTTLGAFHGLTRPPTAARLTPDIDWWHEAEEALKAAVLIAPELSVESN